MKKISLSLLSLAGFSAGMFLAASCAAPSVNPSVQATESAPPVVHIPVYAVEIRKAPLGLSFGKLVVL